MNLKERREICAGGAEEKRERMREGWSEVWDGERDGWAGGREGAREGWVGGRETQRNRRWDTRQPVAVDQMGRSCPVDQMGRSCPIALDRTRHPGTLTFAAGIKGGQAGCR